jgi:hypothetical protein
LVQKSSLPLIAILIGLSAIGIFVAISVDDFGSCVQPLSRVYLTATSDTANTPIQGARASGNIQWLCNTDSDAPPGYIIQYSNVNPGVTPANGTVYLGSIVGNYSLTIQYLNQKYSVNFAPLSGQSLFIVIGLPSGHSSYFECPLQSVSNCGNQTNSSIVSSS